MLYFRASHCVSHLQLSQPGPLALGHLEVAQAAFKLRPLEPAGARHVVVVAAAAVVVRVGFVLLRAAERGSSIKGFEGRRKKKSGFKETRDGETFTSRSSRPRSRI